MQLPSNLRYVRTAGPFTDETLPPGLRRTHMVAADTWAILRVIEGTVHFSMEGAHMTLHAGNEQVIPPQTPHQVSLAAGAAIAVDFFAA